MYLNKLTIDEVRKELGGIIKNNSDECIEYCLQFAIERFVINKFGKIPYINGFVDRNVEKCENDGCNSDYDYGRVNIEEEIESIEVKKTLSNILKAYPDTQIINVFNESDESAIWVNEEFVYYHGRFYMNSQGLPQKIVDCIVKKPNKSRIRWVLRDSRGNITVKHLDIKEMGEVKDNYNDDFIEVNNKLNNLLRSENSWISILHGKPGSGKTSYLRDLIANNKDIKFYWLDTSMFNYIDSADFIEFLSNCKKSVFILEDCENLLKSREEGTNTAMQSLLSISDGMLGDSLNLKFICTFNTDLKNIDEAILRKGRMVLKYEFKELDKEKVRKLMTKLGYESDEDRDMLLCDIYNFNDDNGNDKKKKKRKIGF